MCKQAKVTKFEHTHLYRRTSAHAHMQFGIMAETGQIAQQFVQTYYQTFDTNRANLVALYVSVLIRFAVCD